MFSSGILYAWSLIASRLTAPIAEGGYGWTVSQAGLPYVLAAIVCSTSMLVGGRIQDKIGPRWVLTVGALMMGLGILFAGLVGNSLVGIILSFSIFSAIGQGLNYSSVTAPALKWFHSSKKGLVSGLILGAYGLSAVFYAPLTSFLLNKYGIAGSFIILGIGTVIVLTIIAQLIRNPPDGYIPPTPSKIKQQANNYAPPVNFAWKEMLVTKRFRLMFIIFLMTASVGLMFIGNMAKVAQTQVGISDTAILTAIVSFLALMNALGRVIGGRTSDKIGRVNTLFLVLGLQMLNMAAFAFYQNLTALLLGIVLVGFCFGTLLATMPALCADMYGLNNFGLNYAILFLAWGLAGIFAPIIANLLYDATGSFNIAYRICAVMMGLMLIVNFVLKKDIDAQQV